MSDPSEPVHARRVLVDVAMGRVPAELIVRGGHLVNVLTAEIYDADVAIAAGRVAAVGDVSYCEGPDTEAVDATGRYLVPGLVEGHLHQYHSYVGVNAFVEALLIHGVTATADGFYGPGIIGGIDAVRFFKAAFDAAPIRLIFLVPTLAYLQNRSLGLTPTPGVSVSEMFEMLDWPGCYGLEEPPSAEIINGDEAMLSLFEATLDRRMVVTGHAMGLDSRRVQAYAAMGVSTDHESVEHHDGLLKARSGMKLLMREGSGALNVAELVRTFTEHGIDSHALALCTDLASPEKLWKQGTIDQAIRVAIAHGVPPIKAIQMATINVAEAFHVQQDLGAIAPGRYADIVLVDNLVEFSIDRVIVGGETVVEHGRMTAELPAVDYPENFYGTVKLPRPLTATDLAIASDRDEPRVSVRAIEITEGSLLTEEAHVSVPVTDGVLEADVAEDALFLAMADRFLKGPGRIGVGFVKGFGLQAGAIASSANSVCENLVAVGTNPADIATCFNKLAEVGGGKIIVKDGEVLALVELPLLGLHSEDSAAVVNAKFDLAFAAIRGLGCELANPFSQLEFCFASGEMGNIKLSDEGLLITTGQPRKVPVTL
jgi:adenine deaminase